MWVVMHASRVEDIEVFGLPTYFKRGKTPRKPYRYLPVFETYEAALAWENGDPTHILELREIPEPGNLQNAK